MITYPICVYKETVIWKSDLLRTSRSWLLLRYGYLHRTHWWGSDAAATGGKFNWRWLPCLTDGVYKCQFIYPQGITQWLVPGGDTSLLCRVSQNYNLWFCWVFSYYRISRTNCRDWLGVYWTSSSNWLWVDRVLHCDGFRADRTARFWVLRTHYNNEILTRWPCQSRPIVCRADLKVYLLHWRLGSAAVELGTALSTVPRRSEQLFRVVFWWDTARALVCHSVRTIDARPRVNHLFLTCGCTNERVSEHVIVRIIHYLNRQQIYRYCQWQTDRNWFSGWCHLTVSGVL